MDLKTCVVLLALPEFSPFFTKYVLAKCVCVKRSRLVFITQRPVNYSAIALALADPLPINQKLLKCVRVLSIHLNGAMAPGPGQTPEQRNKAILPF